MGGVVVVKIHVIAGGYANRLSHCVVHLAPPESTANVHAKTFFFGGLAGTGELLARTKRAIWLWDSVAKRILVEP